jgi:hypothetical protein
MGGSYYDPEEENHWISILCRCKTSVKKYIKMSVYCHVTCFCLLMGGSSMTHNRRITDYLSFPTTFDYLTLFFFFFLTNVGVGEIPLLHFLVAILFCLLKVAILVGFAYHNHWCLLKCSRDHVEKECQGRIA